MDEEKLIESARRKYEARYPHLLWMGCATDHQFAVACCQLACPEGVTGAELIALMRA